MEMKVITATSSSEAAEAIIDFVGQANLPLPSLFMVGVGVLIMAADATAGRSEEFKAIANSVIDKQLSAEDKLVALARTYLEFVQKCKIEGRCACGNPECKGNRIGESSESSTSVH